MNVSPEAIYFFKNRFYCRKIAALFADFTLYKDISISGAEFLLQHRFDLFFTLLFFSCISAPLSRLTPIEALPQAPQGLCPLTPQAL